MDPIGQKTRRGLSWNLAGAAVTNVVRLIVLVVLGRMLTSSEFGVVAAAISVNAIVYGIRDVGIGPALVQRKELEPEHLTTAFAVSMYLGVALCGILVVAAPWIGTTFRIPESTSAIRALAVLFVLRGFAVIPNMTFRREMNFRVIATIDTVSFTVGSIVSIVAAVMGAGPWALIGGYLVEEALSTVAYLAAAPPAFSLRIDRDRLRELLSFGVGQTVTQMANMAALYGDNVVVGHALGARSLGFYSRAYDLVRFPSIVFETLVGNVLFPAFSRIQDDKENLATALRRGVFANTLLMFPASAALVVLGPEVIRILIGPGWDDAVLPFQIFALTISIRTTQRLSSLVAQAAGAVNAVAVATVIYVACIVGGASLTVHWGISAVSVSTATAILIVHLECSYLAVRVSHLAAADLLGAYLPGVILSVLVAAIAWPCSSWLRAAHFSAPLVFCAVMLASIAVCFVVTSLWIRNGRGDFAWLGSELKRVRQRFRSARR